MCLNGCFFVFSFDIFVILDVETMYNDFLKMELPAAAFNLNRKFSVEKKKISLSIIIKQGELSF